MLVSIGQPSAAMIPCSSLPATISSWQVRHKAVEFVCASSSDAGARPGSGAR